MASQELVNALQDLSRIGARKTRLFYYADDFTDYVITHILFSLVAYVVLEDFWALRLLVVSALFLLMFFFAVRNGVALRWPLWFHLSEVWYLFLEMSGRLGRFVTRGIWEWAVALVFVGEVFVVHNYPSQIHFSSALSQATIWAFYARFGLLLTFRMMSLIDCLTKRDRVQDFLSKTAFKRSLKRLGVSGQIFHAFLSGFCSDIGFLMPSLIVRKLFPNRSLLFLVIFSLFPSPPIRSEDLEKDFYKQHYRDHHSKLFFTFFHGSHHDPIPCSMIGNLGIWEAFFWDKPLAYRLGGPIFDLVQIQHQFLGMRTHSYLPGVFPYSTFVVQNLVHHVEHHYLKMLPLVAFPGGRWQIDVAVDNYNPENRTWQWFCDEVSQVEGFSYQSVQPSSAQEPDSSSYLAGKLHRGDSSLPFWDATVGTSFFGKWLAAGLVLSCLVLY